jgi:hypothetical protein
VSEEKIGGSVSTIDPLYEAGGLNKFPMDMTEILKYENLIGEITGINPINGPYYMKSFLKAKELAAQYYARASYESQLAKDMAKMKYSIARLDYAPSILKTRSLRVNEGNMDSVADQDQNYLQARNREAYFKAMATFLGHKVEKFQSAHDDAKKIFDQSKDPRGSLPAAPSSKPDYSGGPQ